MEYRLLGPLEVLDGQGSLALAGEKQRALLALLLVHLKTNERRSQARTQVPPVVRIHLYGRAARLGASRCDRLRRLPRGTG